MTVPGGRPFDSARRRRRDRLIAAVIAVVVLAVGLLVYFTSDGRATTDAVGPSMPVPSSASSPPSALTQRWSLTTDPSIGTVASPYGVVVTADQTTVYGHDATTGELRWTYGRSNLPLCAVGSGDVDAPGVTRRGVVRGVMVVSEEGGWCSQVMLLDPDDGERHYVRTSPNQQGGALVFGGPYAGWVGPTLAELWRDDLVRTIQYGDEPAPTKPNARHLGCTFTDLAVAETQFATVEHCAGAATAQVVLNWDDPGNAPNKPSDADVFKHSPRATIDTGSPSARIVGITADSVAVLVAAPEPAVVVYDTSGGEQSRTPVDVPISAIEDADRLVDGRVVPTPAVRAGSQRLSLVGDRLLAVLTESGQREAPPTTSSPASLVAPTPGITAGSSAPTSAPSTVTVSNLRFQWTRSGVLGLPAVYTDDLLLPVSGGLQPVTKDGGLDSLGAPLLPVDRGDWTGRVDVADVGDIVVETRGADVVGLG